MKKPVLIGLAVGIFCCLAVMALLAAGQVFETAMLARWETAQPPKPQADTTSPDDGSPQSGAAGTPSPTPVATPAAGTPAHP